MGLLMPLAPARFTPELQIPDLLGGWGAAGGQTGRVSLQDWPLHPQEPWDLGWGMKPSEGEGHFRAGGRAGAGSVGSVRGERPTGQEAWRLGEEWVPSCWPWGA